MSVPRPFSICLLLALAPLAVQAQAPAATLLKPARVFDGEAMHQGWAVRVAGDRIQAAGPAAGIDAAGAKVVELPGATLMPGLVEGHSHILLHAYNETAWNDQVAHEGLALRWTWRPQAAKQ
jgi:predicted amidohydrolase YtcJ